ncbi:MAG: helix-turn-helix domain-containing protein [Lachnotalea sp.]
MKKYDDFLAEQLQDGEFNKEYDNLKSELDLIRAIVDASVSQNLTQKQLLDLSGINQSDISKFENRD